MLCLALHRRVQVGVIAFAVFILHLPVVAAEEAPQAEKVAGVDDPQRQAFLKAFCVVSVAEVFDKTWFVTLILALKHGRQLAFTASFTALAVHVVIAALLGFQISKFLMPAMLDFSAAALFAMFAILYFKDFWYADADSDMIAAGKKEAEDDCVEAQPAQIEGGSYGGTGPALAEPKEKKQWLRKLSAGFLTVFIAEWGDRTQIAMIGLHSSLPVMPVFYGSLLAFGMLSLSAVLVAAIVDQQKVSERCVAAIVSLSFAAFAVMSFRDGLIESHAGSLQFLQAL
jgi:putative Ca2+/H+ antiporter (TMEM165/GDT1 family)